MPEGDERMKHEIRVGNVYIRYPQDRICEVFMVVGDSELPFCVSVLFVLANLQSIDRDVIEDGVKSGTIVCVRYGPVNQPYGP